MLLRANRLNADLMDDILRLSEKRNYGFVNLETAQSDAAYRAPDTFVTKLGPMWGYRWAAEHRVKVGGRREPRAAEVDPRVRRK